MRIAGLALAVVCLSAHAQLTVSVTPAGALDRVALGERLVGQSLNMRIVKPDWNGAWGAQDSPADLEVEETADGDTRVFAGRFLCEGKPCEFTQRLEPVDDGWRVSYTLTPSADLDTELIVVLLDLPTEGNAGDGRFLISDGESILSHPLPATLPDPYHIAGESPIAWCAWLLPGDVGLLIEPDGEGITGCAFQDNRQFNFDAFQAHFAVRDSRGLKADRTYAFGLTLRPFSEAVLAATRQAIVDLQESIAVDMTSSTSRRHSQPPMAARFRSRGSSTRITSGSSMRGADTSSNAASRLGEYALRRMRRVDGRCRLPSGTAPERSHPRP